MATMYDVPTVDVNNQVLLQAYKMRPDISRLYCDFGNPHPETGQPWCPGWPDTEPGKDLQIRIMKDWWINAAGRPEDTPSIYGNSMAEWVRQVLGIDPGAPVIQKPGGKLGGVIDEEGALTGVGGLTAIFVLGLFLFIGDKQKRIMAVSASKYFENRYGSSVKTGRKGALSL